MNRRHYLLTVALSLAAGLAGHALYGPLAAPPAARAAAEPRRESPWEYCAVVKSQAPSPRAVFWIAYFRGEGVRTETVEATLGGNSQAKAIAKLGEEGWEMVGEGPLSTNPDPRPGASAPAALFFKRRKG
jgi:predicted small lipoprotein YifL